MLRTWLKEKLETPFFSLKLAPLYFALGATVYGFVAILLSIGGVRIGLVPFFVLNGVCTVGAFRKSGFLGQLSMTRAKQAARRGKDLLPRTILAIVFILIVTIMIRAVLSPTNNIDLLGHLLSKSKILLHSTFRTEMLLHDPLFANLHSRYPPLFSVLYHLLFLFLNESSPVYFQITNYFLMALLAYALFSNLCELTTERFAALWVFIFVSAPGYLRSSPIMDNADFLLSFFFFISATSIVRFINSRSRYQLALSAITAGAAALTKNEGMFFVLPLFFILPKEERKKSFLFFFIIFAILIFPWWTYQLTLPSAERLSENLVIEAISSYQSLKLKGFLLWWLSLIFGGTWLGMFALWILSLCFLRRNRSPVLFRTIGTLVGWQLSVYGLIMWVVAWNFVGRADVFANRILCHIYPLASLLVGSRLGGFLNETLFTTPGDLLEES